MSSAPKRDGVAIVPWWILQKFPHSEPYYYVRLNGEPVNTSDGKAE
jgi:hypothetical protein